MSGLSPTSRPRTSGTGEVVADDVAWRAASGTPPLSQDLFTAVNRQHQAIADHAFFGELDTHRLSRQGYIQYLRDQAAICGALEDGLAIARDRVGALADLSFARTDAIAADLRALHAPPGEASAAAARLAARIREAEPVRLMAHAWVTYMAMLNGGQPMRAKLHARFGTARFLQFVDGATRIRDIYSRAVDDLQVDPATRLRMRAEARIAFAMHRQILDADLAAAQAPRAEWPWQRLLDALAAWLPRTAWLTPGSSGAP
jgi:heme oxygenase